MNDPRLQHLKPKDAWAFLQTNSEALLIDVRMEIESMYVGRPPKSINIPWYEYPKLEADAKSFVAAVKGETLNLDQPIVLICRSGARTLDAGKALLEAGFTNVTNVLHGFEGSLDDHDHRSTLNGWRFDGLPWEQM